MRLYYLLNILSLTVRRKKAKPLGQEKPPWDAAGKPQLKKKSTTSKKQNLSDRFSANRRFSWRLPLTGRHIRF